MEKIIGRFVPCKIRSTGECIRIDKMAQCCGVGDERDGHDCCEVAYVYLQRIAMSNGSPEIADFVPKGRKTLICRQRVGRNVVEYKVHKGMYSMR